MLTPDLQDLAQIAIALAGFTGIIGTFQQRGGGILTEREKLHIVNLLLATTVVVFMSFVPSCLFLLPGGENFVWARAIRILFVVHIFAWAIGTVNLRRFLSIVASLPVPERLIIFGALLPAGIVLTLLEGVAVFGYLQPYIPFLYEVVMLFFLAIAMTNFVSLLVKPA